MKVVSSNFPGSGASRKSGSREYVLPTQVFGNPVERCDNCWLPSEPVDTIYRGDTSVLPLMVTSRLALPSGERIKLSLLPDGRME